MMPGSCLLLPGPQPVPEPGRPEQDVRPGELPRQGGEAHAHCGADEEIAPDRQPGAGDAQQGQQAGSCPKTWMVESILVTLFCCLPLGIVGIINASRVSSAHAEGRYADALRASQDAGKWTKIGFWLGLVGIILYILVYVFIFGAAILANS